MSFEENIIEDGDELPVEPQKFKEWYDENMAYAHTGMIDGEQVCLMPAFDFDSGNDEFLDVELDKAYMVWKGARSADSN